MLSSLLQSVVTKKELFGMKISKSGPELTHLLFTDNSLLFCQADTDQIKKIKQVLEEYEVCSGQKINMAKSSLFFNKNTSPH